MNFTTTHGRNIFYIYIHTYIHTRAFTLWEHKEGIYAYLYFYAAVVSVDVLTLNSTVTLVVPDPFENIGMSRQTPKELPKPSG